WPSGTPLSSRSPGSSSYSALSLLCFHRCRTAWVTGVSRVPVCYTATPSSHEPQCTFLSHADGREVFVEVEEPKQTFPVCHTLQRFGFLLLDGFREREHLSDLCFRSHDDTVIIAEDDIARHNRHTTARDRDLRRKDLRSAARERKNGTAIHRELHGADGGHIAHGAVDHTT